MKDDDDDDNNIPYNTKTTTTVEIHKTSSIALDHRAYSRKKIPQVRRRRREKEHRASLLSFLFCFSPRSLSLSLFIIVAFEILLRLSRVFFCPPFAKFSRRAFPWCRDGVRATKCAHKRVQKQSRSFYSVMCDFDAFARVRLVVFHSTERERHFGEKGCWKGCWSNTSQILSNRYEPLRFKHTSSIVSCVRILLNRIFWLTVTDRR